jgi:hypothetical protein
VYANPKSKSNILNLYQEMNFIHAILFSLLGGAVSYGEAPRYLIATSPSTSVVAYLKLPDDGSPAVAGQAMRTLIKDELKFPQGIAVDQYRKRLFIADPNLGHLVMYPLSMSGDMLSVGKQQIIAKDVEVRAVAVDGLGNVIFSEEPTNSIQRVSAASIDAGNTVAEILYSGNSTSTVSEPGGVAVDNYFVYWLNKNMGTQAGTVVRGRQQPTALLQTDGSGNLAVLARNSQKCYGACIALGNLFYTDDSRYLYGTNRAATARQDAVTVNSELQFPRGCAFDGAQTVYVADKGQDAIFQFASNVGNQLRPVSLSKAADLQGAFGVAVYVAV